jgi:hypothetical protein
MELAMVDQQNNPDPAEEDKEKVQKIARDIIEPALQKALADATKEGSAQEVVSALANCYGGLLVDLMGRKAAAAFMQGHAIHLTSVEENPLNS